ncbi:S8 family peptidase, partial [Bacillus manliponensis]
ELDKVIKKASKKGITIVSAVGNGGLSTQDTITYPAKLEGVIGIGATNNKNERWFKSSRGEGIDVMAPGENIYGTTLDNKTVKQSGTSVAAAYTTGVIALLKQHDNDISNVEIEKTLKETATSLGSKYEYGSGIMNEKELLMHKENKSVFDKLLDFFK